jgi:hypothetical protein
VHQLHRRLRVPDDGLNERHCTALRRGQVLPVRRDDLYQLQRRLCMSVRLYDRDAGRSDLSRGKVQYRRRPVVHQLQRRVRVSIWLDDADACCRRMPCGHLQSVRRDSVHQL